MKEIIYNCVINQCDSDSKSCKIDTHTQIANNILH